MVIPLEVVCFVNKIGDIELSFISKLDKSIMYAPDSVLYNCNLLLRLTSKSTVPNLSPTIVLSDK